MYKKAEEGNALKYISNLGFKPNKIVFKEILNKLFITLVNGCRNTVYINTLQFQLF